MVDIQACQLAKATKIRRCGLQHSMGFGSTQVVNNPGHGKANLFYRVRCFPAGQKYKNVDFGVAEVQKCYFVAAI